MSFRRMVLLGVLFLSLPASAFPQSAEVSGVVVDARTERPLARALVALEGGTVTVEADDQGRFRLEVAPGTFALTVSLVGYALSRHTGEARPSETIALTILLSEGVGSYQERVTVSGSRAADTPGVAGGATLYQREMQALRGVTLDDPLRAVQSLPSAVSTDDFYSEFAVRGSPFRQVGLTVDGIPSHYMMHSVHGVSDGGSIAMINTDAVASVSLLPGSYAQRNGRHLGAEVDLTLRDGARDGFRGRAGLSGTSATLLTEGPLPDGRGSWLISARRSYLDLLLNRISDENSLAFGFTDAEAKFVLDVSPRHQLQALAVVGTSGFDEDPEQLGLNDEATVDGRTWLTALTWRYTPSSRVLWTHRVYATGLSYSNHNSSGAQLDDSVSSDVGWRSDAAIALRPGVLVEAGGDVLHGSANHARWRSLNDEPDLTLLNSFRESAFAASAHGQVSLSPFSRLTVTPGVRVDSWGITGSVSPSPWATATALVGPRTQLRAGAGTFRQFADFEQVYGLQGGSTALGPESALHADVGLVQGLPAGSQLQVTWFAREERNVLWTPGEEPRRLPDGTIQPGRGDAPWTNALDGRTRGLELVLRRDTSTGFSGWIGYAYGRHRYTDRLTNEQFWGDVDQRHALSVFGLYRLSNRTTLGAKFRYGSNYPMVGYIQEQAIAPGVPPLFGGGQPVFFTLSDERNTLRLPAYARLDLRADRTFSWSGRRVTLFVEVANALNRANVRNVPYDVDRLGRVMDPTAALMPILPSAGFAIEF